MFMCAVQVVVSVAMVTHRDFPTIQLHVSRGQYMNISLALLNNTLVNSTVNRDGLLARDSHGEMLFIIIIVCVYSMGMVAFVASHIYKRSETKSQERQISDYLSLVYREDFERSKRTEHVRRTSSSVLSDKGASERCRFNPIDVDDVSTDFVTSSTDNSGQDVADTLSLPALQTVKTAADSTVSV